MTLTVEVACIFHLVAAEHGREGVELNIGSQFGVGRGIIDNDLGEFAPVGLAANQIVAGLVSLDGEVAEEGVQCQVGCHRRGEVVGLRSVAHVPVYKGLSHFHGASGFGDGAAVSHHSLGVLFAIDIEHDMLDLAVVGVDGFAVKVALGGHRLIRVLEEEDVVDCNAGLYRRHVDVVRRVAPAQRECCRLAVAAGVPA